MKHNLTSNANHKEFYEVSKKINELRNNPLAIIDDYQFTSNVHPLVSNYAYNRVQKELENERFVTLIKLARAFDEETLNKCINVLGYTLNVNN